MNVFLHERGKSIPALPLRLTTVQPEQVVTAIPVIGMSNFPSSSTVYSYHARISDPDPSAAG